MTGTGRTVLEAQLHRTKKKNQRKMELANRKSKEKDKKKQAYLKASSEIAELEESKWSVSLQNALVNYKRWKTDSW